MPFAPTREFVIKHAHNEASGLIPISNQAVLDRRGWDMGFWIISDERPAGEAIAALGHKGDGRRRRNGPPTGRAKSGGKYAPGWEVVPLRCTLTAGSSRKATEDCEALARAGGWVYVIGSQFGPKDGPLEAKRQFVARFNEATVEVRKGGKLRTELDVARPAFLLHRLINDALRARKIKLIPRGRHVRRGYIDATRKAARKKGSRWAKLVKAGDRPINVEGCTFLPGGRLLIGLRYPVTAKGQPIVVEVDGIDRVFGWKGGGPEVVNVVVLSNVGSGRRPRGVRELSSDGWRVHVITGSLDRDPESSLILKDHPEGDDASSEHQTFAYPVEDRRGRNGTASVKATLVRKFNRRATVEGIAAEGDGDVWYVHDDKHIRLEYAEG